MAIMNITDMPKRQDAFCGSCKAEVMVLPDLACPRCGDQVAPESLARMPGTPERPTGLLATVPERKPVQPETTRTAEIVNPTSTEPAKVTLPSIDDVVRWHADTRRLHESVAGTEARLVVELRGVRQMRKLLDHTLGMIEAPSAERGDSNPWSQKYPACLDCGTTTRLHMAMGRCRGCYGPWIKAGRPS